MKRNIIVLFAFFTIIICSGCSNSKSFECKHETENEKVIIKWKANIITTIIEETFSTEKEAIDNEKEIKENDKEIKVSRKGNVVVSEKTEKSSDGYSTTKALFKAAGYTCK